jgi:hypothetical protein
MKIQFSQQKLYTLLYPKASVVSSVLKLNLLDCWMTVEPHGKPSRLVLYRTYHKANQVLTFCGPLVRSHNNKQHMLQLASNNANFLLFDMVIINTYVSDGKAMVN